MSSSWKSTICIVCDAVYSQKEAEILGCPQCGLLYSGQNAGFGNPIQGMGAIAFHNYSIVADAVERSLSLCGVKILDVGSAEGGFTELLLSKGADTLGLEPDKTAARQALEKKLPVKLVSFESFTGSDKEYDVIVFNDVFEHMQDPVLALEKSYKLLKDAGFIVINVPVSTGFIFRVVQIAARIGIKSPYQRIWAQGLCSPHIYFYSENNLRALLEKHKFEFVERGRLLGLATDGMYKRVRSTYGPICALIISTFTGLFSLISNMFPPDVIYLLFKKK
jgi:SAM-dependent methyltransferase